MRVGQVRAPVWSLLVERARWTTGSRGAASWWARARWRRAGRAKTVRL